MVIGVSHCACYSLVLADLKPFSTSLSTLGIGGDVVELDHH